MTTNLPSVISAAPVPITHMAEQVADSRFFQDALTPSTALVKLAAGRELGLPMMSALQNIHVIKGKATLGYSLVAAMIRRHPDYDYRVLEHTDETCTIQFLYKGDVAGDSSFTIADAEKAGLLSNPTWRKFPRNMLFARALTNGARYYCPDVFMGAVYTRDEIDEGMADVDAGDASEIIDAEVIDLSDVPPPVWQTRFAEAIDTLGGTEAEQRVRTLMNGADPQILGSDEAWTRLQGLVHNARGETPGTVGDGTSDPAPTETTAPDAAEAPTSAPTISQAQLKRLAAIANELGLKDDEWKAIALHAAGGGIESRKLIPRDRYEQVEAAMREAAEDAANDEATAPVAGEGD